MRNSPAPKQSFPFYFKLLLILGVAIILLVVIWLQFGGNGSKLSDRGASKEVGLRPPAPAPVVSPYKNPRFKPAEPQETPQEKILCYHWRVGDELLYDAYFNYVFILKMDQSFMPSGDAKSQQAQMDMVISGRLSLRVYEVTDNRVTVGYTLKNISFSGQAIGSNKFTGDSQEFVKGLEKEVVLSITPLGRIGEMGFQPEVSPEQRNFLKGLISATQITLPEKPQNKWTAVENDTTGIYEAGYSIEGNTDVDVVISKTKKYLELYNIQGNFQSAVRGKNFAYFNQEKGILSSLESDEEIHLNSQKPFAVDVYCTSIIRLKLIDIINDPENTARIYETLQGIFSQMVVSQNFQPEIAKSAERLPRAVPPWEKQFADLQNCVAQGRWLQDSAAIMISMSDLFRQNATSVSNAIDILKYTQPHEDVFVTLTAALATSGNPTAEKALLEMVLDKSLDNQLRHSIISSFTNLPNPSPETLNGLLGLLTSSNCPDDLVSTSIISLGVMAGKLKDTPETEKTLDFLEAGLKLDIDPDSQETIHSQNKKSEDELSKISTLLSAIGAASQNRSLSVIRDYLFHEEEQIRLTATDALRNLTSKEAMELVIEKLEDPSARVRLSAVKILSTPKPDTPPTIQEGTGSSIPAPKDNSMKDTVKNLKQVLIEDEDETVRLEALKFFIKRIKEDPSAKEVITQVANQDASEIVRNAALAALQ